eukprot:snap_masked-scaffold_30-processed-gene-1.15-mRNA-1 protein AED:1.00 eAED:1.00 QI:0/0/0/0/1/1/2/0/179
MDKYVSSLNIAHLQKLLFFFVGVIFSKKDIKQIKSIEQLDISVEWKQHIMQSTDMSYLIKFFKGLNLNQINFSNIKLGKSQWEELFSVIMNNANSVRNIVIVETANELSALTFFNSIEKHKEISAILMKNIISKNLHKQLLKYTKSYGENFQELGLEINFAAFYTFKYAPSLNNLSDLC